jgi:branched-chain amino acid transport system permease protein
MDLDILVRGLTAGSLYALVAVGFNILYRPTNVFNFAQGDLVMLGAMLAATLSGRLALPWYAAAALAIAAVAVIALIEERVAVAPILRRSSSGTGWVITTLAFSLVIANLVGHIWGPDPLSIKPPPPLSTETFEIWGARLSSYHIALVVLAALLVLGTERFYGTLTGKAVLAVAEDRDAALLRGIDPERLSRWSFLIGGAFAALTGVLAAPLLYASTGLGPALLLKGFEAAALGGIGNNRGALIAGYILGIAEAGGADLLSPGYQDAFTFALVLALLLVRPQGLFGRAEARTV